MSVYQYEVSFHHVSSPNSKHFFQLGALSAAPASRIPAATTAAPAPCSAAPRPAAAEAAAAAAAAPAAALGGGGERLPRPRPGPGPRRDGAPSSPGSGLRTMGEQR